jgi:hypothetical protein
LVLSAEKRCQRPNLLEHARQSVDGSGQGFERVVRHVAFAIAGNRLNDAIDLKEQGFAVAIEGEL